MKLEWVLEELKNIQSEHWNIDIHVKHRDEWWSYYWSDECLEFFINESICYL